MYRKTYVEINLDNIEHNIKEIKKSYNDYEYYFGVIKANAYGHGLEIVNTLIESGINYLAVATLDEAISVRKINKEIPILCLEPAHLDELDVCIQNNITITLSNLDYYYKMIEVNLSGKLKMHLKLDTGMNRLGIKYQGQVEEIINDIKNHSNLVLEGLYTHLGTTGVNDSNFKKQLSIFEYLIKNINLEEIPIVHIGRSATLAQQPKIPYCNGIRLGIIMYGFNQNISEKKGLKNDLKKLYKLVTLKNNSYVVSEPLPLKPAFSLYSEIIEIKHISKGDYIGYGINYQASKDMTIGIIAIGHGDGIDKTEGGSVLINNQKYQLLGIPCMDMIFVSIDENVNLYDKVTLIGDNIPVNEICNYLKTNYYAIFNKITKRAPRIYLKNSEVINMKGEDNEI